VSPDERASIRRMTTAMRSAAAVLEQASQAMTRASFALLDLRLSETSIEDLPAVSWEVEREAFLRRFT